MNLLNIALRHTWCYPYRFTAKVIYYMKRKQFQERNFKFLKEILTIFTVLIFMEKQR